MNPAGSRSELPCAFHMGSPRAYLTAGRPSTAAGKFLISVQTNFQNVVGILNRHSPPNTSD